MEKNLVLLKIKDVHIKEHTVVLNVVVSVNSKGTVELLCYSKEELGMRTHLEDSLNIAN